jgi:disulfide bond formation protein DsbB
MPSLTDIDRSPVDSWLLAGTIVALMATSGSLWFSLGLGLVPCDLCWYQRILMYPLVVILGVAAYENRPHVWKTVLPLSIGGVVLAGYHTYLQATVTTCSFAGPCATIQWKSPLFGLTIPNLSLIAFALVNIIVIGRILHIRASAKANA